MNANFRQIHARLQKPTSIYGMFSVVPKCDYSRERERVEINHEILKNSICNHQHLRNNQC